MELPKGTVTAEGGVMWQSDEVAENNKNDRQVIEELYHIMYRYMLAKDVHRL